MMKIPTNRATTAKATRKFRKNPSPSAMSSWSSLVTSAPVSTSMSPGTCAATRSRTTSSEIPSAARTLMDSNLPSSPT